MKINNATLSLILLCLSSNYFIANDITPSNEGIADPVEAVFTRIYNSAVCEWFSRESVSGVGSELRVTNRMRQELGTLIKRFGITSIADAPCGDLNWMKHVDIGTCRYIGIDIVKELIESNIRNFGPTREFRYLNLIENIIEKVDLIICRDMLAHLTYEQIATALRNFKNSGSKYILVTTNVRTQRNVDIEGAGGWRTLNLELTPFNFPDHLRSLKKMCRLKLNAVNSWRCGFWMILKFKKTCHKVTSG